MAKNKTKLNRIENENNWSGWTWNPVTGCKHGCPYCYARYKAMKFYTELEPEERFNPHFWEDRQFAPEETKCLISNNIRDKIIFTCNMGDLFGDFIPDEWIEQVLKRVRRNQQWIFAFLTKNPKRLVNIDWPQNAWVGATIDYQYRVKPTEEAFKKVKAPIKFISCEPLEDKVVFSDLGIFDWLIIGGRNESAGMSAGQPEWEWVQSLLSQAKEAGIKVFCRANLWVGPKEQKPREYPVKIKTPKVPTF